MNEGLEGNLPKLAFLTALAALIAAILLVVAVAPAGAVITTGPREIPEIETDHPKPIPVPTSGPQTTGESSGAGTTTGGTTTSGSTTTGTTTGSPGSSGPEPSFPGGSHDPSGSGSPIDTGGGGAGGAQWDGGWIPPSGSYLYQWWLQLTKGLATGGISSSAFYEECRAADMSAGACLDALRTHWTAKIENQVRRECADLGLSDAQCASVLTQELLRFRGVDYFQAFWLCLNFGPQYTFDVCMNGTLFEFLQRFGEIHLY